MSEEEEEADKNLSVVAPSERAPDKKSKMEAQNAKKTK